ncbi:transcription-repair coupling factor, partial [bacterium]|nr:transcription-repair coupling factor [bacterium]
EVDFSQKNITPGVPLALSGKEENESQWWLQESKQLVEFRSLWESKSNKTFYLQSSKFQESGKKWEYSSSALVDTFVSDLPAFIKDLKTLGLKPECISQELNLLPPSQLLGVLDGFEDQGVTQGIVISPREGEWQRYKVSLEENEELISEAWTVAIGSLSRGFCLPALGFSIVVASGNSSGVSGRTGKYRKRFSGGVPIPDFAALSRGDFVIHRKHGLGKFMGITQKREGSASQDYILIDYNKGSRLSIPVSELYKLEKFSSHENENVTLHDLGGKKWDKQKEKALKKVAEVAKELVTLYARRSLVKGFAYPEETQLQKEFEAAFPWDPTPDQLISTADCKKDLERQAPMDRLVCGDAGYGKTEVAIRVAFKAVVARKQVAILVPTTLLAAQHYESFAARMEHWPIRIELLNRFKKPKEKKQILHDLTLGKVDVIVGTTSLLAKAVKFSDLGLVIIDEEQRFGVRQKEALRAMRLQVDTLSMSATPIPRTLHLSLGGVRDISIISTPPRNRVPVQTVLIEQENFRIKQAIENELERDGQIFIIRDRIEGLEELAHRIRELVPEAQIAVAHGQMKEGELEETIFKFTHKQYQILVCTTIVEAGIDIPNVNSIIIWNAQRFGLGQLYQLRGRVGRSGTQGYCYLAVQDKQKMRPESTERLNALMRHTELGSGFQLAMRDLEIRGAGNLLGDEQSGFMSEIGMETYFRMIREEVRNLQGELAPKDIDPKVEVPLDSYLSASYIEDGVQRLSLYQKYSRAETLVEIDDFKDEIRDRFGPLDSPAEILFHVLKIRHCARILGFADVRIFEGEMEMLFPEDEAPSLKELEPIMTQGSLPIRVQSTSPMTLQVRLPLGRLTEKQIKEASVQKAEQLLIELVGSGPKND